MILRGSIIDPLQRRAYPGAIRVEGERIVSIEAEGADAANPADLPPPYIMPGFVEAHVHIESSMLTPREFARVAVRHGTLAAMPDPHEIANVLGIDGVRFMMDMAEGVPFTFGFGVPSCVPSTPFETAGGELGSKEVAELIADPRVTHLSEVMNAVAVINRDPDMMAKLDAAKAAGKPIDGHAPLLSGDGLKAYAAAGISNDHECSNVAEAREKIALGFDILLRNGSAARDFDALLPILHESPERCAFCSDDKHPDELLHHHINAMVAAAVADGVPLFDVLRAANVNAVRHYKIDLGLLQPGDYADFIVLEDLVRFQPVQSWHHGRNLLSDEYQRSEPVPLASCPNNFQATPVAPEAFAVLGRRVVDATPAAQLARLGGAAFTEWPADAETTFSRVRLTCDTIHDGTFEELGRIDLPESGKTEWSLRRTSFHIPVPALTPTAIAVAESKLRNATWTNRTSWIAPRVDWLPQDAIAGGPYRLESPHKADLAALRTSIPGLDVLGACSAFSRADAAKLARAPVAIVLGERLGKTVAPGKPVSPENCFLLGEADADPRRLDLIRDFHDTGRPVVRLDGLLSLPVLEKVDVLVVGGGTGGAPAAIAAAREGARTLLLEAQHALGGVGTIGCISRYCCGRRSGFTGEVTWALRQSSPDPTTFNRDEWDSVHKGDWMRRQIEDAGGTIWFGAVVTGVLREGDTIRGAVVSTPWGSGLVEAGVVIDSTGSADVACAAGCECTSIAEENLAVQGAGLASLPIPPSYNNTDYTFIDDNNPADVTRALVVARRRFRKAFDLSPIPGTRERRQIVGDVTVRPQDIYTARTWHDTICHSVSDFDSHGYVLSPLFHVQQSSPHYIYEADLPMGALLPRGLSGIAVTGLAISGDRDAMPIFRMQPDVQNHGFAIGLAAAMAVRRDGEFRHVPVRDLQRRLMAWHALPEATLVQGDRGPWPESALESAAGGPLDLHSELSVLLDGGPRSIPYLRRRLATAAEDAVRVQCAKVLAALGDGSGEEVIIAHLRAAAGHVRRAVPGVQGDTPARHVFEADVRRSRRHVRGLFLCRYDGSPARLGRRLLEPGARVGHDLVRRVPVLDEVERDGIAGKGRLDLPRADAGVLHVARHRVAAHRVGAEDAPLAAIGRVADLPGVVRREQDVPGRASVRQRPGADDIRLAASAAAALASHHERQGGDRNGDHGGPQEFLRQAPERDAGLAGGGRLESGREDCVRSRCLHGVRVGGCGQVAAQDGRKGGMPVPSCFNIETASIFGY